MASVPTDALAAAKFLIRHMYRPIDLPGGKSGHAVAETAHPFAGDSWFWTDDNAKVLEFLAHPELRRHYSTETAEIFAFLRTMCRPPFMFRRFSLPRLEPTGRDGTVLSFYHSLMHLRCNLPAGAVIAGVRFHDKRTADHLLLGANSVEFSHRGRRFTLDVGAAIDQTDASQREHLLVLRYSSELYFQPRRTKMRLGRVTYTYEIDARSMLIGVEAVLEIDPGLDVADVVLTIGHDHLSHGVNGVSYTDIAAAVPGGAPARFAAAEPGRGFVQARGAQYYVISQREIAGFALAIHSAPREPKRLAGIDTLARLPGELHCARARYRFDGPCRGARLVAAEDKLLTAGGFYDRVDDYARLMRDAIAMNRRQATAYDFSVSYDYGAELNAFARYFTAIVDSNHRNGEEIKALFDVFLENYLELFVGAHLKKENTIFSRQLAFVILGVITMYRKTGEAGYRERLAQLCDVLLEFEKQFEDVAGATVSGFMMGTHTQRNVFVDCHSAALLALTEAAEHIDDARFAAAIDRGLGCYCLETARIDWHDGPRKADVVAANWVDDHGTRHSNNAFWNYHVGLTLRFFTALCASSDARLREAAARHRSRIGLFEMVMRRQLEQSIYRQDGALEIRSSVLSTETNSETQPWAALGLFKLTGR